MILASILLLLIVPVTNQGREQQRPPCLVLQRRRSLRKSANSSIFCGNVTNYDCSYLNLGNDIPFSMVKELAREVSVATSSYLRKIDHHVTEKEARADRRRI